ncbi:MAG: aminotransferase class V-fold PLP-dependent enzyme [Pseudohongiellaceae bacterium]
MNVKLNDSADCSELGDLLAQLAEGLDDYLTFTDEDAMLKSESWRTALGQPLPEAGAGIQQLLAEIREHLLPNASPVPKPGFSAFITTGASSAAILAALSAHVAAPQRFGLNAFNYLENLSLEWLAELLELAPTMQGVYCSGGSIANIVAMGAARQAAFERLGVDPARDGISSPCRVFASAAAHRTIHRAAAVLGMGRASVVPIAVDASGRMRPDDLLRRLAGQADSEAVNIAIVANAGSTDTGAIDPLEEIGLIAKQHDIWFHVDGAYGLPGILDPVCKPLYKGMRHADSTSVDPHKWLGAPVGVGATFVRDPDILQRAFTQETADYLEGSFSQDQARHSMDSFGIPYHNFGLELSAPSRGVIVWAIIREIGRKGLAQRVIRHNAMARHIADRATADRHLELVLEPVLSICCFRYHDAGIADLNDLNRRIHRELVYRGVNMPSTTTVHDKLVIRPCFIGARTQWAQADALVDEVIEIGRHLSNNI